MPKHRNFWWMAAMSTWCVGGDQWEVGVVVGVGMC